MVLIEELRGGREELPPAGVCLGRRCRGAGGGAHRCLPGGDRRSRVAGAVVAILHQERAQLPGEQGAARRRGLRAAEPGQRPAVLEARPDQLSQSSHLSRAGAAGATPRVAALRSAAKAATCSWAAPRASARRRTCSRRFRRSGGSTGASDRRVTTGSSFPSSPRPSCPSCAGGHRAQLRAQPAGRRSRSNCCSSATPPRA